MKIYKISQNVNNEYDTYDSMVVCAENEEEAKRTHPSSIWTSGGFYNEVKKEFWTKYANSEETYQFEGTYGSWTNDLTKLEVIEIGEAKDGTPKGVIVASFNAG